MSYCQEHLLKYFTAIFLPFKRMQLIHGSQLGALHFNVPFHASTPCIEWAMQIPCSHPGCTNRSYKTPCGNSVFQCMIHLQFLHCQVTANVFPINMHCITIFTKSFLYPQRRSSSGIEPPLLGLGESWVMLWRAALEAAQNEEKACGVCCRQACWWRRGELAYGCVYMFLYILYKPFIFYINHSYMFHIEWPIGFQKNRWLLQSTFGLGWAYLTPCQLLLLSHC